MMNQTKKHTTGKKLLALLLALIMTVSLLPMSVFAAEPGAEETPVVEGQTQPAAETGEDDAEQAQEPDADEANEDEAPVDEGEDTALPGDAEGDADDADAADDGIAAFAATDATMQYRILHLDCGREYFSKDWIIALVNEMSAAGYNQLQLAFGNGGFRFVLNDMAVGDYGSDEVKTAIKAGNEYYNTYGDAEDGLNSSSEWLTYDPKVNALTESEMTEIISYASSKGIEIVPMFNTPGHMHALLAAMEKLGIGGTLSVKAGCMNLENTAAVAFTKALIEKYAAYFSGKGCKFFNLAMDEYNSFDSTFYTYAKDAIGIVTKYKMTPRVFNDGARTQKGSVSTGTQVCFWYGSNLNQIADSYSVINTNHDYYYVSTNESWNLNREGYTFVGDYNESIWVRKAEQFSNTVFYGRVTLDNPVGSMFCVWCNTPGKNDETEIAHQIRMILRVMAARMDNKTTYSSSDVIVTGGFNADGTINGSSGGTEPETPVIKQDDTTVSGSKVQVAMGATTTLTLSGNKTATWSSSDEKILKLEAVSSKTRAAVAGTNAVQVVPVATGTATVTAKLDDGAELSTEVTVTAAPEPTTVDVTLKVGETKSIPYKTADYPVWGKYEIDTTAAGYDNTIANVTVSYETKDKTPVKAESITSGESYYIMDDTGKVFLTAENGRVTATTDVNKATKWKITALTNGFGITGYEIQAQVTDAYANYYLTGTSAQSLLLTSNFVDATVSQSSNWFCSKGLYYQLRSETTGVAYGALRYVLYDSTFSKWSVGWDSSNVVFYETTADQTNISFEGIKTGTTKVKVSDVTYNITVTQQKVVPVELEIGQTSDVFVGAEGATITKVSNSKIATASLTPFHQNADTTRTLDTIAKAGDGVISDGNGHFIKVSAYNSISVTDSIDDATVFTITNSWNNYTIQAKGKDVNGNDQYLYIKSWSTLAVSKSSSDWKYDETKGYYDSYSNRSIRYSTTSNNWTVSNWSGTVGKLYTFITNTIPEKNVTNITFTGVKAGTTTYVIDDVTYVVTVKAKEVPVTLEVDDSVTFDVGTDKISTADPINEAIATAKVSNDGILTLTGMSEGETSCTVGDTQYKITVVKKSTVAGSDLYVDLWVTNHGVLPNNTTGLTVTEGKRDSNNACRVTITYQAEAFNSVDGQLLSKYLPQKGKDVSGKNTATAVYWKTRYLPASVRQTIDGWTNKSGFGTDVLSGEAGGKDIERIRYYAGTWSYLPVDSSEWVAFTTASTGTTNKAAVTSDETGAQIAVFYLLETEVTNEVTTFVTDWPDSQSLALYGVALDYCVKYQGEKTRNPSSYGMGKTTQWFQTEGNTADAAYTNGYMYTAANTPDDWKGKANTNYYRVINNIEATNSSDYEVYMITVTPSAAFNDNDSKIDCPDTINYSDYIDTKAEKVIWAESLETAEGSDMTLHSELQIGGEPRVNRVLIQRGTGMLVTYYVRAREKQDNLHVYYIDRKSNVGIFDYEIIPSTGKENHVTFEHFTWNASNIAGGFTNGTNWVWNSQNLRQSVEWDLANLKDIAAKYKVSYKLVDIQVENGADGKPYKVLKLYYESDNSRTYVVDFGVPAKVERLGKEEFTKVTAGKTDLFADGKTTNAEANATNGKLYVGSDNELYYQLTTMQYTNPDVFNVTYTYADNTSNTYTVTFIPASNVYYEDDDAFITFAGGQGKADAAQWKVELDKGKTADESKQIAEVLSKAKNVYGTDPTYENSTMFSLGRAHKVTVSADMVNNWNENSDAWPTAEFTFKGTGFDVISLTDNKSGVLTYKVEQWNETSKTWSTERKRFVSNYYGLDKDGNVVPADKDNALYQLPVVKVDGLDYGTYRVTLTVAYASLFDKTGLNEYSFWLDGVRIYDPAGSSLNEAYAKDGEGWPKYIELHDELVKSDKNATALFIEGNTQADIKAYTSYGPNHEVYLLNEQILAFKLANTDKVDKIHIGAKAPMGHARLEVNGTLIEAIQTATDMYYDITALAKNNNGKVIITNAGTAGDSILSLTQLKVTYKAEPTETELASLAILTETEKQQVVQMVRAMYAPVEPEVFAPERFEASWNRSTVKVGQKATLTVKTSTDVDVITVDGVAVTNYRTRTQRTGWGWNATKVTYREFTYTITAAEAGTLDYSVVAVNADGVSSEPITAALTVQAVQRPQRPSWLDKIFSRWF